MAVKDEVKSSGVPATMVCPHCNETMVIGEHLKFKGFQQIVYDCDCGYRRYYHIDSDGKHAKAADIEALPENAEPEAETK